MTLQSCLKYNISVDHTLPPETSCAFIKECTLDLVDYLMKIKPEEFPFAQVVVSIPSKQFEKMVGPNVRPSGKGFSEIEATNSVLFEIAERYSNTESLRKKNGIIGTLTQLGISPEELYENFFPSQIESLNFPAIFPYTPMRWDSFYDLSGNVKLLPTLFYYILLHGSNGLAAGNTLEEAILHGAYEVIERHCVSILQKTEVAIAPIDRDSINNPYLNAVPSLQLYDISFLEIPTILGVLPVGDKFFCIAGCAGTRTEALNRLLSETAQLNTYAYLKKQGHFTFKYYPTTMHTYSKSLVCDILDSIEFNTIPEIAKMDILDELHTIQEKLTKSGMTLYWKDNTGSLRVPSVSIFIQRAKMDILVSDQNRSFSFYKGVLV